jgi:outer membrane protein assembly factor BamB
MAKEEAPPANNKPQKAERIMHFAGHVGKTPIRALMVGILTTLLLECSSCPGAAENWPQFRGPHGQGRASDSNLPLPFGPETPVLWKKDLQQGHSSPCIWEDTLFLTMFESEQLTTVAMNRHDGSVIWKQSIPPTRIEKGHRNGTPANSTPITDGRFVYVYFGSFGLVTYDFEGTERWRLPLPVPITQHGASSSPLLANGRIILQVDQDVDSHLLGVDALNGKTLWKTPRPGFRRGFSTPIAWPPANPETVITSGTLRVCSYDLNNGRLLWEMGGLPNETVASPAFDEDRLYISGWTMGSGVARMPDFDELLKEDANANTLIEKEEATGPARMHFGYIDANKDNRIDREEWESLNAIFNKSENALLALNPGPNASDQPTLAWKQTRGLPYVPSPLAYRGHVYLIKNGGMITCLNANTGEYVYQEERVGALGDYYASPIGVDDYILMASQRGVVTVIEAGAPELKLVHQVDFNDTIMATPAAVDDKLYLRTSQTFYCFGQ